VGRFSLRRSPRQCCGEPRPRADWARREALLLPRGPPVEARPRAPANITKQDHHKAKPIVKEPASGARPSAGGGCPRTAHSETATPKSPLAAIVLCSHCARAVLALCSRASPVNPIGGVGGPVRFVRVGPGPFAAGPALCPAEGFPERGDDRPEPQRAGRADRVPARAASGCRSQPLQLGQPIDLAGEFQVRLDRR